MRIPKKDIKIIESSFSNLERCIKEENNWSAKSSAGVIKRKLDEYKLPKDHRYWRRLRKMQSGYSFNILD